MTDFRVTYKNSWKEIKTIKLSAENYWDALDQANKLFGRDNIISVEAIDKLGKPDPDYSISKFTEFPDWYHDDY